MFDREKARTLFEDRGGDSLLVEYLQSAPLNEVSFTVEGSVLR